MPNNKSRLIQLGVVAALTWTAFWSLAAHVGYETMRINLDKLNRIEADEQASKQPQMDRAFLDRTAPYMVRAHDGDKMVTAAVQWGVGVPLTLMSLAPFGSWVYRRFKPKPQRPGHVT
jgi:hypothetical protein